MDIIFGTFTLSFGYFDKLPLPPVSVLQSCAKACPIRLRNNIEAGGKGEIVQYQFVPIYYVQGCLNAKIKRTCAKTEIVTFFTRAMSWTYIHSFNMLLQR